MCMFFHCGNAESYPSSLYYVTPHLQEGLQDCVQERPPPIYAHPAEGALLASPPAWLYSRGNGRVISLSVLVWEFPCFN